MTIPEAEAEIKALHEKTAQLTELQNRLSDNIKELREQLDVQRAPQIESAGISDSTARNFILPRR